MNIESSCIPLPKELLETRCFEPRPTLRKSNGHVRYVVQVLSSAKSSRFIEAGVEQGLFELKPVSFLKVEVNQTVIIRTFSNEELIGIVQLVSSSTGPHDKVRIISGARVLNISASQVLGIIREAR